MMHVVYISREFVPSQRAGGIASYVKEISQGMRCQGHEVSVITASDNTRVSSEQMEDGVRVIRLSGGDFFIPSSESGWVLKKLRALYRFHSYRRILRKVLLSLPKVDIVEVADYAAEGLYLEEMPFPLIVRLHTPAILNRATLGSNNPSICRPLNYLNIYAERRILGKAKYITSCSQALLEWMKQNVNIAPRLVSVIKNPVASISNLKNVNTQSNDIATIFYAGTLVPTKGVEELYEACRILNRNGRKIRLVMAGKEGVFGTWLREKSMQNGDDWCLFMGHLSREELFSHYASAMICCFPSWWENMPMVCLEAMMFGAIVVGSNSGGMSEIINDGINGFLVPRKNTEVLADCLNRVLSLDENDRNKIKHAAKKTIAEEFNIEKITSEMIVFYNHVVIDYKNRKQ